MATDVRPSLPVEASSAPVPFLDLRATHADLKDDIVADFARLIDSSAFSNGPAIAEFEATYAAFCGTACCVGMSSGLDALRLALLGIGLESGDEVIVPANTFVATVEAVTQAGARPVLADASELDYNIDPAAVEAAVSDRTRAVIPVHLYGQVADMRSVGAIAERHSLDIVEDACQAHGAERDGVRAGGAGKAAAFSFYPGKNLGAMGDAGALVTDDAGLAARARALREHGQVRKYIHEVPGYTARLDTLQALVLLRKLSRLDGWNEERRSVARFYTEALSGVGDLRLPPTPAGSAPVWHLYVLRTGRPEALAASLRERGIGSGRHYPEPVHLTRAYRDLGYRRGEFPIAERLATEVLSLPIFPGITERQVEAVVDGVTAYFRGL